MAAIARLADTSDGEIGNNNRSKASFCLQSRNTLFFFYFSFVCSDDGTPRNVIPQINML